MKCNQLGCLRFSRIVVVKLVVLNRIDKAESKRTACVLCQLQQSSDRLAPAKESPIAELFVCALFRQAVCVDNRRAIADGLRQQALSKRQPLTCVIAED